MRRIFVDSGAFVAIGDRNDAHHRAAIDWLRSYSGRFITSSDVLDESATRLRYDGGLASAERFRELIEAMEQRQRLEIVWTSRELHQNAWDVLARYPDVTLSFTDALSIAIAEARGCDAMFAFDRDFLAVGVPMVPQIERR